MSYSFENECPVDTPEGWYGGEIEEVSVGRHYRRWRNIEGEPEYSDVESFFMVEYSESFERVELTMYAYDPEQERYYNVEGSGQTVIMDEDADDMHCAQVAVGMMRNFEE